MYRKLKKGDILYIKSIDRLGRNYEEIIKQWKRITRFREADIVVLDMPLLDTRRGKDLMGTFLSDIVLQVLSFVAESDRTNIKKRQADGIAVAKARWVNFGRPEPVLADGFGEIVQMWRNGQITGIRAAKMADMPMSTFRYRANKYTWKCHE